MQAVKVRGPFRGGSGYDHHTRAFVRELTRQGVAVQLDELTGWSPPLPEELRHPFFESLRSPVPARAEVQFAMPHQVVPTAGLATVNFTMFEATRIPPAWVAPARTLARTVVPTQSSFDAWVASGVPPDRLRMCPLGVRRRRFAGRTSPLPLEDGRGRPLASYRHRFLNVAELSPRKNLVGLLETWMRATGPRDDAVLILKSNVFRGNLWRAFTEDLAEVARRIGKERDDYAPVAMITEYLPDEHMPRLYRTATHYVSMSFGEGWDLPMMEAAASGLSLIAPRHSAYVHYLDDETAHWIPAREGQVDFESRLARHDVALFQGLRWWKPDIAAATELFRAILDGRAPRTASPRRRILERFGWDAAARRLIAILAEL